MFSLSLSESIVIGFICIIAGFIVHKIVYRYGCDEIKKTNMFYVNRNNIIFYVILFIIGISIHGLVKYAQINEWYCEKECVNGICEVICHLPINNVTTLFITK
jgi:hypothetical protein